jgi:hypothetical protein
MKPHPLCSQPSQRKVADPDPVFTTSPADRLMERMREIRPRLQAQEARDQKTMPNG